MAAFTYMGTKKSLAHKIGALCREREEGPFLDLFSGISAAGTSVAPERQIWCNDAQVFSRTLTEALYLSSEDAPRAEVVIRAVHRLGDENLNALIKEQRGQVEEELKLLWDGSTEDHIRLQSEIVSNTNARRIVLEGVYSHCVFSTRYAGTYLGLIQAIQIDSIRYGSDIALERGLITVEEHRWSLLAMCRSIAAVSNSTGHFAQYLSPSESNIKRVLSKRRRCAWAHWADAINELRPIGDSLWRSHNRVFHGDAIEVLEAMHAGGQQPAIIYADPPYTNDQYSRYYHLLETALLYDYPLTEGKGLYREGRFRSSFSLAREVDISFERMISCAAKTGSSLMISYPSNGLLRDSLHRIPELMAQSFDTIFDPIVIPHKHSTMGGSKGREKEDVEECIFVATHAAG